MLKTVCLAAALAVAAPALAGSMVVTDDPYKSTVSAEIATDIPAQSGWRYCHTGGKFAVWVIAMRNGSSPLVGVTAEVHTLRSPGEAYVELLGGLPLAEVSREAGGYNCRSSCYNDSVVSYSLPPETLAAIKAQGSVGYRVSFKGEPNCTVEGQISAADVAQLSNWAAARH